METDRTAQWTTLLREQGFQVESVLGSGMEGMVLGLGDDLVAKVWHSRTADELETLRAFYAAVSDAEPRFGTSLIHRVLELDGQCATVERRLPGRPLRASMGAGAYELSDVDVASVLDVLSALGSISATDGMGVLPVLPGEPAFDPRRAFEVSLSELVESRVRMFRGPLSRGVGDLDAVVGGVTSWLHAQEPAAPRLVHGDLIPANVLVDDEVRPTAVLDFGFLTTVGDPAFDAAIASSIHDMYGSRAAINEAILSDAVIDRFGYEQQRLWVYRAAYALCTANCFSASGSDGHFRWCVDMLARPRVREAIGL